jgi:hypothetical protein
MYVFGGRESEEKSLNDLWKLNLESFEWVHINKNYEISPS